MCTQTTDPVATANGRRANRVRDAGGDRDGQGDEEHECELGGWEGLADTGVDLRK